MLSYYYLLCVLSAAAAVSSDSTDCDLLSDALSNFQKVSSEGNIKEASNYLLDGGERSYTYQIFTNTVNETKMSGIIYTNRGRTIAKKVQSKSAETEIAICNNDAKVSCNSSDATISLSYSIANTLVNYTSEWKYVNNWKIVSEFTESHTAKNKIPPKNVISIDCIRIV